MSASTDAWDRVLLGGTPVRGQPMRVILGRTKDAGFQRLVSRLRAAGADLQTQSGSGAASITDVLLLGAHEHTLTAWASLQSPGALTATRPPCPPDRPLRCLALWRKMETNLEMNSWLEAAQAGATPLWHQAIYTNDTINHRVVTRVGTGLVLHVRRDTSGARLTLMP